MSGWRDRVEDLLYSGERVVETVDYDGASVVVTSHRVLGFDPDGDGPTLQQADRPNVEAVSAGADSDAALLGRGLKAGAIGVVLVGAGLVVDFGSLVGDVNLGGKAAEKVGAGGLIGMVQQMLSLIAKLDYLLRVFGGLALFLAAVMLGVWWVTRDPQLVVEVAGSDDIHLPRPDDSDAVAADVERAVALGGDPAPATDGPTDATASDDVPTDPLGES